MTKQVQDDAIRGRARQARLTMRTAVLALAAVGLARTVARTPALAQVGPRLAPRDTWTYVGSETCYDCHDDVANIFDKTDKGRVLLKAPRNALEKLGCESCHGPGSEHVKEEFKDDPSSILSFGPLSRNMSTKEMNSRCVQCHSTGEQRFWHISAHKTRGVACVDCHTIMQVMSQEKLLAKPTQTEVCAKCHPARKAQLLRSSHMPLREGKMKCSGCHNPHGSATGKLLQGKSINETCYSCHAEKRGPFLWEHAPARENCLNCHDPHGSLHDKLLKVKRERLCQRCHLESRHPTQGHSIGSRFAFNRSCQNCHAKIHGSNHPSGRLFHR